MSDNITTLRASLFDVLKGLKAGTMEVDKARAINDVAQTIINTAKVEIDFMKTSGSRGTGFIPADAPVHVASAISIPAVPSITDQLVGANVRTHRMQG